MFKGLILAAGGGTRLRPFTLSQPKHLIPLLGKAIIEYVIEDLVNSNIKDIGVVIGHLGHLIQSYLGDGSKYGCKFTYIMQERRLGIAHAIHLAIEQGFINKEFIVYLGDNILSSGIKNFVEKFQEENPDVHIFLCKVKDPSRFGVAIIRDGRVVKLVEKPKEPISDLALVGVYLFRDPDLVEKAFKTLKPSWRGEYEITDLIQWFIDNNYKVTYDIVTGWWKDVGTPEGLLEALYLLLDKIEPRINGEIHGNVYGKVIIEKGAEIYGNVYGPAYIGENVVIDKNAVIEHYVSVEKNTHVKSGTLTRTLVLSSSLIDVNKLRLVDSVIGRHCRVIARRELYGNLRLAISDYSRVDI